MSGHSKWATIKHKKGALDAKRGKIFTRLIKEITMAAKSGGDPEKNPRLRRAVAAAKAENMPADNIKRAIQRGTGELPGVSYEEITFEGYGPGGVAILVEVSTDNRNRTVSEIRHAFSKNGGNMGEAGSVAWMFHKKGDIIIPKSAAKEDDLMNIVLEAGAEDLKDDGESWEILTDPSAYEAGSGSGEEGGHHAGCRRSRHDSADLHQARRPAGQHHDSPAGGAGRFRRRAARLVELRHRPEAVGGSGGVETLFAFRANGRSCSGRFALGTGLVEDGIPVTQLQ